jgi:flagellar hook-basal body complex protein FliE
MITRPSTSRVLEDVVDELTRDIMPSLTDPAQQIRLHMLMIVLNDCANASEREISVMRAEIPQYLDFARDVAAATGDSNVAAAVEAGQMGESLVLSDVIDDYQRASRAFSTAMDLVMDTVNRDFIERGEDILRMRMDNERAILSGVAAVGRSAS